MNAIGTVYTVQVSLVFHATCTTLHLVSPSFEIACSAVPIHGTPLSENEDHLMVAT